MKNTIITSAIIFSMTLSSATAFATGNECRKVSKNCNKSIEETLKFSVTEFVGKEDSQKEETACPEYPAQETPEKFSGEKESSVNQPEK